MAVTGRDRQIGLFRALLLAHAQMMMNRTRKAVGRRGLVGLVVVVFVLLLGAVPLFAAFAFLGYLFGRGIDEPVVAPLMGGILAVTTVGFGVVGGLLGGARQLTWEAFRAFPVPFHTLFFAETFASLGDLVVLAFVGVMLAMGATFSWQAPWLAPLVALLLGQLVLWALFLQHLVGAMAVSAVRRLRRAVMAVIVAAWAGVSFVASAARDLQDDLHGEELEKLKGLWQHARPVVNLLPPVLSVRSMAAAHHGALGRALRLQLPIFGVTLALGAVSYVLLRRETTGDAPPLQVLGGRDRLFLGGFSPLWVLARLHFHHVAGSLQGRFGLFVPLITVVLVKGPLGSAGLGAALTIPGSVLYLALAATQFQFNQFGLDGQGVKTLFLLPLATRDILVGKALGLLLYSLAQNALLLGLLAVVLRPSPADAVASALLACSLAVAHALEGHWVSAIYPRPLAMHRMNSTGLSGASLLPLAAGLVNGTLFGGVYAIASRLPTGGRLALLASLLVFMVALYRAMLPAAARFVDGSRERVVEVLG